MSARLTKIKIENFKTFQGTCEVTLKPFTAVLGGNGSGKSNLLDSVWFALGGNVKELRCNRLSDLISGSSLQLSKSTSVTVHFELGEDGEKEFTRVVRRSSCKYFIDAKVTDKETYLVQLKAFGIDISSQILYILQGTVQDIALKSPNELMALFEIISGSFMYKDEYKDLQNQLNLLTDQLHYINNRKKSLMSRHQILQLCINEEKNHEKMLKTLNSRQIEAYLVRILIIRKHIGKQGKVMDEIQSIKRKKESFQKQTETLINNKLHQERNVEDFEFCLRKEEIELKGKQDELGKMNDEIYEKAIQIDKYVCSVDDALIEICYFEHQITEMKQVLEVTNEDIKRLEENILPDYPMIGQNQIHEYFTLEENLKIQTSDLLRELQIQKTKQSGNEDKLKWENDSLDIVIKKEEIIDLRLKHMENKKSSVQSKLLNCQNYKDKTILSLNRSKEIIQKSNTEQHSLQAKLEEVTTNLMNISMDKNAERLKNERINTLEKLKSEFFGVFGRVIDICNPISPKYGTCVTSVFRKHMMSIVVSNSCIATKCINFLKGCKLPRETFLPLDNIHSTPFNEELRYIRKPKGIIPIRDLIKYDIKFEPIINYIIKNTVACETPKDARYVAYFFKYNAVSLDGCRYWPSGIMSGGELDLEHKGGLWDQDFDKLNKEKINFNKELQDSIKTKKLELQINSVLSAKVVALQTKIECCEEYIKNTESNIVEDTNKLKQLQDIKMKTEENIVNISEDIKKRNTLINELQEKYNKVKTEIFKHFFSTLGTPEFNLEDIRRNHYLQMEKGKTLSTSKCALEQQIDYELKQKMEIEAKVIQLKTFIKKGTTRLAEFKKSKESLIKEINDIQVSIHKIKGLLKVYEKEIVEFEYLINNIEAHIKSLSSEELFLLKKDVLITNIHRGSMQEELRSILLECQATGISLPIKNGGSFKHAVNEAIEGRDINVNFDYSCLPPEIVSLPLEELIKKHEEMQDDIHALKIKTHLESVDCGNLNEKIIEVTELLSEVKKQSKAVKKLVKDVAKRHETVQTARTKSFMRLFDKISTNLNLIYQDLNQTKLCSTSLILENDTNIFSGGIYYFYNAPGKPCVRVTSLSLGECTTAGIALLYAIHRCYNSPFLLLDEIDSYLDSIIIKKMGLFFNKHKKNIHVLSVSHNDIFCEASDQLVLICQDKKDKFKMASKVISNAFE